VITRPVCRSLVSFAVICVLPDCSHPQREAAVRSEPPSLTVVEARAVGCYRLLAPVRNVSQEFVLLARRGRGSGPERFGQLIRPRGAYKSAYWHQARGDTLELIWTSTPSDSAGTLGTVIFMDALRARVGLSRDTLRGGAKWAADVLDGLGTPTTFDFRARRVSCRDSSPR